MTKLTPRTCAECGRSFEAKSPRAKFCPGGRCRKAASRRSKRAAPAAGALATMAEVLEELDAMVELLPDDIDELEDLAGAHPELDLGEVLAGLEVHERMLTQIRDFLRSAAPLGGGS